MTVHAELGSGFLEAVYQAALTVEFSVCRIPFKAEQPLEIRYRNHILPVNYRADFICYNSIIVELKALSKLSGTEKAQVINYLKATGFQKALLINFGEPSLKFERIVLMSK